jgi:hypothetical protein
MLAVEFEVMDLLPLSVPFEGGAHLSRLINEPTKTKGLQWLGRSGSKAMVHYSAY